jgi:hypothetical protein
MATAAGALARGAALKKAFLGAVAARKRAQMRGAGLPAVPGFDPTLNRAIVAAGWAQPLFAARDQKYKGFLIVESARPRIAFNGIWEGSGQRARMSVAFHSEILRETTWVDRRRMRA